MANIKIEKLVIENTPVAIGTGGAAIGDIVNSRVLDALETGARLQSVEVFFEASDWSVMEQAYHGHHGTTVQSGPKRKA